MISLTIGVVGGIFIGFAIGYWHHHRNDGSSLRDLDKYSGRF